MIMALVNDPDRLLELGGRAREVAYPEAAGFIVRACRQLVKK
jgi:hypothetical protein